MWKVLSKWIIVVVTKAMAKIYWVPTMCRTALRNACKREDLKKVNNKMR